MNRAGLLRGAEKLCTPFPKNCFDLILIFLRNKIVETRGHFAQDRIRAAFNTIFRMKLQFGQPRLRFYAKPREKRQRHPRCVERKRRSLAVLEKFAAAKIDGTAFLPQPAQTDAP